MRYNFEIGHHHVAHQIIQPGCRLPTQLLLRLGRVANQEINFCRTEITRINTDKRRAGLRMQTGFVNAFAFLDHRNVDAGKGLFNK